LIETAGHYNIRPPANRNHQLSRQADESGTARRRRNIVPSGRLIVNS
jgi:hypothetical protein